MSEAIFHRLSAIVRIAPWAAMAASSVAWAWKWLAVSRTASPVSADSRAQARNANSGMGVDPGPDRRPAERHLEQLGLGGPRPAERLLDLAGVAAELLAEPDRRRVLEVRPAGLDDRPELLLLGDQRRCGAARGRAAARSSIAIAADSWSAVGIVSFELWQRLTSSFGWTFRPPEPGRREVGDDLVHVGVGRGAEPGLVDVDRELVVVVAVGDRCGGRRDRRRRRPASSRPSCAVRLGGGQLDQGQRPEEAARASLAGDREVQDGPLGRGAVQGVGRDLHLAHRIALGAGGGGRCLGHGPIVGRRADSNAAEPGR